MIILVILVVMTMMMSMMPIMPQLTCDERRCSMRAMSKAKSCAEVGAANSHLPKET